MASVTMRQLLEAGVHFGHQTRRWDPKMRPYIFSERNGIHIIDLRQTLEAADKAAEFIKNTVANFQTIHKRVLYMRELERMDATGEMEALPKKERLRLRRELAKLQTVLGGVRDVNRVPDAVFIIDVKAETIAVKEANRLKVPIVAVVDTNCDPDPIDMVIPGNDDAIRASQLMATLISDAAIEGAEILEAKAKDTKGKKNQRGAEGAAEKDGDDGE